MSDLIKDKKLYEQLSNQVKDVYFDIHAIYSPSRDEPIPTDFFGDCYLAAVDLFSWKFTFRVYFKITDDGEIDIQQVERWHFG